MPKLRVFAGPNGSGKSTIKAQLDEVLHIHTYVNADELEAQARASGFIDLEPFGIRATFPQLLEFHTTSHLLVKEGLVEEASKLGLEGRESTTVTSRLTPILPRSSRISFASA